MAITIIDRPQHRGRWRMAMVYGVWDRLAKKLKLEDRSISSMHGREMWFWREESLAIAEDNGGKVRSAQLV